jgi:hypothetical protein
MELECEAVFALGISCARRQRVTIGACPKSIGRSAYCRHNRVREAGVKRVNWESKAHVTTHIPIEAMVKLGELQAASSIRPTEIDLSAGHVVSTPTELSTDSVVGLRMTLKEADAGKLRCNEDVDVTASLGKGPSDSSGRLRAIRIEIENLDPTLQPGAVFRSLHLKNSVAVLANASNL